MPISCLAMICLDNKLFKIAPPWPGREDLKVVVLGGPLMWINWWVSGSLFICNTAADVHPFQKDAVWQWDHPACLPICQLIFYDDVQQIGSWIIPATMTVEWVTCYCCWSDGKFLPDHSSVIPVQKMQHFAFSLFSLLSSFFPPTNTTRLIQHCFKSIFETLRLPDVIIVGKFLYCGFERKEFLQSTHPRSAQSSALRQIIPSLL